MTRTEVPPRPVSVESRERGLLVVLLNPSTGPGARTLARVDCVKELLGFNEVATVNLFGIATLNSRDISHAGVDEQPWQQSRPEIQRAVAQSDEVVLAYGVASPTGLARRHYQEQVSWLETLLEESVRTVWLVGGRPLHPSRWQRHTWRRHPDLPFREALALELTARER